MSSFEKLRPQLVPAPAPPSAVGTLGRITLDSRRAASPFRDFGGGDAGDAPAADVAAAEPAEPAAPVKTELEQAVETGYADGFDAGRAAATAELVGDGETFAQALGELARFRAGLLERYQSELLAL